MKNSVLLCIALFALTFASSSSADDVLVKGTVFDESGKPVAGAKVYTGEDVLNPDKIQITDNAGRFALSISDKKLHPWLSLYAVSPDQQQLGTGRPQFQEGVQEIPEVSITLKPARIITGTVLDTNGQPAEGVLVGGADQTAYPHFARTDKEGKFRFAYPKDDTEPMQAIVAILENVGMDYLCTEELEKYRGKIPPEKIKNDSFQLKLNHFESFKIRVVDEHKTPLSGITVYPYLIRKEKEPDRFNTANFPLRSEALTDSEGIATVQSIGNGTTFCAVGSKEGNVMPDGTRCFFSTASENWNDFDKSEPIPTLVLRRRGNVKGSVKTAEGTPVPWSRITIKRHNACGHGIRWTNQNGEFEVGWGDADELFDIGVESTRGAAPGVYGFDMGNGIEEKRLDFVLEKGIRLYGMVYKPDGTAAEQYQIFLHEKCPEDVLAVIKKSLEKEPAVCPPGGCETGVVVRQTSDYFKPAQGKYEYLLPAAARKYDFYISLYSDPDLSFELKDYQVKGNENEFRLDFHLKPNEGK